VPDANGGGAAPVKPTALVLVLLLLACASPDPDPPPDPASRSGFAYRGVTHVSWWHDEYGYDEAPASRAQIASTRANWAGVLVTWYMETRDSVEIAPVLLKTPEDAPLVEAIRELHGLGLKVMLKPHVDVLDGTWRGAIDPSDEAAWFSSYAAFITRYARLAEASGVDMLCVGTELATLSDARHAVAWAELIAGVRSVYKGPLTYAANAVSAGDEFTSVAFWDRLDVAGLDAYTPLTDSDRPGVGDLVRGWSRNRNGEDMVAAFRNWQRSHGKPVIFTELGYRSADGTNRAPWDFERPAAYDAGEQADCYEAAFRVWSQQPWMRGIFWWSWPVPPPGPADTDYSPRNKPAEPILTSWQTP
jgi:hypothetical protein